MTAARRAALPLGLDSARSARDRRHCQRSAPCAGMTVVLSASAIAATALMARVVGVLGVVGTGAYARQTGPRPPAAGDDPALLVPRRSGLGLTVNFGHPRGWVVLAALIALLVISAAAGVLAS
jgi:hypothetical protein